MKPQVFLAGCCALLLPALASAQTPVGAVVAPVVSSEMSRSIGTAPADAAAKAAAPSPAKPGEAAPSAPVPPEPAPVPPPATSR
ncbi:hypothetical protein [Phaeospirillum tilakii]|uniref:Uncharacterized protein n=1 Tax=Phaeospirillum tilakii TaxID=741673 RepID=A0ABW5CCL5_9PROT